LLLNPYGGPGAARVRDHAGAYAEAHWFAEAGCAVLICDGRGTPDRGPGWEHAVAGDLLAAPLADQVTAAQAALSRFAFLDPARVAIRGWSFGGTLAAMAVSVYLLAQAIQELPVGTAYTVWTGIGAVTTAGVGVYLFDESTSALRLASILLVVVGIAGLQVTGSHAG